jgi:uncharacterized protein
MGKQEIISIIRNSKPEIEARYGVMRVGSLRPYIMKEIRYV